MSYDIWLKDPVTGKALEAEVPHDMRGGMYAIHGTAGLWLNITYNYGRFYREAYPDDGIRTIYGKSGVESIPYLEKMIAVIKEKFPDLPICKDYWEPCAGNALKPLYQLLAMAKMRPDGVWEGD